MKFSVTERGTAKRCRRQAVLTSKNGRHLSPMFTSLALATGSVVHRAHQLWLDDAANQFPLTHHTLTAANEAQDRAVESYQRNVGCAPSESELGPLYEAIDFCMSMAQNYEIKYNQKLPDRYKLISTEQKISVPVPGTEHRCDVCNAVGLVRDARIGSPTEGELMNCPNCEGGPEPGVALHYLEGRLDGMVQDLKTGAVGALERKTYKSRPREASLKRTDQFKAYEFLTNQLGLSDQPSFILYDGLWRRKEVPRGRTFDDLFARYIIRHTPQQMEEFARFLPHELNDMYKMYRVPDEAYTTIPWMGCTDCGMVELCDAMTQQDKTTIEYLLTNKYTERTDDIEASEVEGNEAE